MDRTTTQAPAAPCKRCDDTATIPPGIDCPDCHPDAPAEPIKGARTINEIVAGFKERISLALAEAMKEAYGQFVNDCDLWARSDVECNTTSHAREAIREMLAGEDPAYVVHSIKSYGFRQADTIRDLILARHADPLVKKALEEKDAEIARLKELLTSWSRR